MTKNEVRELFQEILNSDMAMREEDEGQISPILQKIRQALTRTPSTNNEVVREWDGYINGVTAAINYRPLSATTIDGANTLNEIREYGTALIKNAKKALSNAGTSSDTMIEDIRTRLLEIEKHHVLQNDIKGRDESRSKTLRLVRECLSLITAKYERE